MKHIVTILAALFVVSSASAQIVWDQGNIQDLIGKRQIDYGFEAGDTTGTIALTKQVGQNQTWDITSFQWAASDTSSFDFLSSLVGTAGENDPDFASSNLIQINRQNGFDGRDESYLTIDANGVRNLGSIQIGDGDTTKILVTPSELNLVFPFTFGVAFSDSVQYTRFNSDSSSDLAQITSEGEVDGFGTLITPDGSIPVLRYHSVRRQYFAGNVAVEDNYEWWDATGPIFLVSISTGLFPSVDVYYATQTVVEITSIDDVQFDLPANFALQQNYPNPFNPSTMIPFELKESASVKLVVFDMLGREVETLVNGTLPVGVHQVEWTPSSLTGGMYVVQIDVNGRTQARTMTLLK